MNNKNKVIHNDLTVLKHYEIYNSYKKLCRETREKYPQVADFVARQYYYDILSEKFNLTPNYICTIVCKSLNDEQQVEIAVRRAHLNIQCEESTEEKE